MAVAASVFCVMGFLNVRHTLSTRRGVAQHALVAFGGAGGQSACAVASLLGVGTVIVPRDAGLLSALGLGSARIERFAQRQVLAPLTDVRQRLSALRNELASDAQDALRAEGVDTAGGSIRTLVHMRFLGQDATIAVELADGGDPERDFLMRYEALYGYRPDEGTIEVESMRVVVAAGSDRARLDDLGPASSPSPDGSQLACFGGRWSDVPIVERAAVVPGRVVEGRAVVVEDHGTTVVEDGWRAEAHARGALILRK